MKSFIKNLSKLDLFVRQVAPGVWVPQTGQVRQEYVDSSKLCGRGGGTVTHSDSPPEEPACFLGPVRSRSLLSCCRVPRQAPNSGHVAGHRNTQFPYFCKLIKAPNVFFQQHSGEVFFEVKLSSGPVAVIKMFEGGSGGGAPVVATWQRLGQALRLSGWPAGATGVNGHGHTGTGARTRCQ